MLPARLNRQKPGFWKNKNVRFARNQTARNKKSFSPEERVKLAILGGRLNVTSDEAARILQEIQNQVSGILEIPDTATDTDIDFSGRDLDLVFTVNKQNTPKKAK